MNIVGYVHSEGPHSKLLIRGCHPKEANMVSLRGQWLLMSAPFIINRACSLIYILRTFPSQAFLTWALRGSLGHCFCYIAHVPVLESRNSRLSLTISVCNVWFAFQSALTCMGIHVRQDTAQDSLDEKQLRVAFWRSRTAGSLALGQNTTPSRMASRQDTSSARRLWRRGTGTWSAPLQHTTPRRNGVLINLLFCYKQIHCSSYNEPYVYHMLTFCL